MLRILQAETGTQITDARRLFREYEAWLGMSLCFQDFESEVASLPGRYTPPEGRLLLAYFDDRLAGGIAMRKLSDEVCEMKRLFVRDEFRGHRIGTSLVEQVIAAARSEGYSKMRLDTHPPKMGKAVSLYESHGFRPIEPYYDNPHSDVLFMELDL